MLRKKEKSKSKFEATELEDSSPSVIWALDDDVNTNVSESRYILFDTGA